MKPPKRSLVELLDELSELRGIVARKEFRSSLVYQSERERTIEELVAYSLVLRDALIKVPCVPMPPEVLKADLIRCAVAPIVKEHASSENPDQRTKS